MNLDNTRWKLSTLPFAYNTVILAEKEKRDLQKLVNEFSTVCVRTKEEP